MLASAGAALSPAGILRGSGGTAEIARAILGLSPEA
jgi:hypothetical protein